MVQPPVNRMGSFLLRAFVLFPPVLFAASLVMILVAGFDPAFKPCPNYGSALRQNEAGRENQPCWINGKKSASCTLKMTEYPLFCGNHMQPRATTCCRVPCGQNDFNNVSKTTYFDARGNSADCKTQEFKDMSLAVGGCTFLVFAFFLTLACWWPMLSASCRVGWGCPNLSYQNIFGEDSKAFFSPATNPSRAAGEAIPDATDAEAAHTHARNQLDDAEVQVV
jgi:hypothetical protein